MRDRFAFAAALVLCAWYADPCRAENWNGWRGPRGDGTSLEKNIPTVWNGITGKNVEWKVPLPGFGHSSAIVWEDRIFVVACVEDDRDRILACLDRSTGKTLWQQVVMNAPLEKKHTLNSFASGTPVTDGRLVYVTFLEPDFSDKKTPTPGNMVVAAYDFDGNRQWLVKPGRFSSMQVFQHARLLQQSGPVRRQGDCQRRSRR
jgi:outer membrane protein assembly factor BamB